MVELINAYEVLFRNFEGQISVGFETLLKLTPTTFSFLSCNFQWYCCCWWFSEVPRTWLNL